MDDFVLVTDHEGFATKHLPDLGHDAKDFKVSTWKVTNWKDLEKKLTSPEFDCGEYKWKILLFPYGISNTPSDTVSLYLNCAGPKSSHEQWHVCAQFALVISNPFDPSIYTVSHAHHRFNAEEDDWGFTQFRERQKLLTAQEGQTWPTIENDSVNITAFVRVIEDPTGVLWHNFKNYDSKKATGYVGLINSGTTSYINTFLQSLYLNNYFRKILYQIPTENDKPTESTPLALQRIFYRLQTSDGPVSTMELTKSFGWKSIDYHIGHDMQDLRPALLNTLDTQMKGTNVEGAIRKLFFGKMNTYIKHGNSDCEELRIEDFNELRLKTEGMRTLQDSFKDYVAVKAYDSADENPEKGIDLQDVTKRIVFESLPPVLHLWLDRFKYHTQEEGGMVMFNDRHEFPLEVDLSEFLHPDADRSQPWVYKLYASYVCSGGSANGSYFTFIRPDCKTRWFKFSDDRVTLATEKDALEKSYGDGLGNVAIEYEYGEARNLRSNANACTLIYIRESAIGEILAPLAEEDIPFHLKNQINEERLQLEIKKREREANRDFLTVKVVTDGTFSRHEGFDLAFFDGKSWLASDLPSFRVSKTESYTTFKDKVAQHFNYTVNQIRLWVLVNRQNKTVRPDAPIPENEPALTVGVIQTNMASRQDELRLYLDVIPDPSKSTIQPQSITIFLKHFNTSKQTLCGAGKVNVFRNTKIGDLVPVINERMQWTIGTPLKLYEEIKPGMIERLKPKLSFAQNELQDGDIICFQVELPEEELRKLETQGLYSNPSQFYDFLRNRVKATFKHKIIQADRSHPEFDLVLSKKQDYNFMAAKVGEYLGHDHAKLRFTTTHANNGSSKSVLKSSLNQSIAEIMASNGINSETVTILYEKLNVSAVELETMSHINVTWTGVHNKKGAVHSFRFPKTSRVHELTDHISKRVTLNPDGSQQIRIFRISDDRKMQIEFAEAELIENFSNPLELYAEEIPKEESEAHGTDKIISVFHFSEDLSRTHGVPFKFVLKQGENFVDTKKRLQARVRASDVDFSRYRFALILPLTFKHPFYIHDGDTIYESQFSPYALALDHSSEPTITGGERAII